MQEPPPTSIKTLIRAAEIGQEAGLHYVYAGNIPGRVGDYENTRCVNCQQVLVERYSYVINRYSLTPQGTCPRCGTPAAGVWHEGSDQANLGGSGMPRPV